MGLRVHFTLCPGWSFIEADRLHQLGASLWPTYVFVQGPISLHGIFAMPLMNAINDRTGLRLTEGHLFKI